MAGLKRKHDEAMLFIEADFNKTVKSKRLKKDASAVLFGWLFDHILNPYPTLADKQVLAKESKLSMLQVRNWLTNQRKRHWLPMKDKKREPRTHLELLIVSALAAAAEKGN